MSPESARVTNGAEPVVSDDDRELAEQLAGCERWTQVAEGDQGYPTKTHSVSEDNLGIAGIFGATRRP
jgi:hypothetical protein